MARKPGKRKEKSERTERASASTSPTPSDQSQSSSPFEDIASEDGITPSAMGGFEMPLPSLAPVEEEQDDDMSLHGVQGNTLSESLTAILHRGDGGVAEDNDYGSNDDEDDGLNANMFTGEARRGVKFSFQDQQKPKGSVGSDGRSAKKEEANAFKSLANATSFFYLDSLSTSTAVASLLEKIRTLEDGDPLAPDKDEPLLYSGEPLYDLATDTGPTEKNPAEERKTSAWADEENLYEKAASSEGASDETDDIEVLLDRLKKELVHAACAPIESAFMELVDKSPKELAAALLMLLDADTSITRAPPTAEIQIKASVERDLQKDETEKLRKELAKQGKDWAKRLGLKLPGHEAPPDGKPTEDQISSDWSGTAGRPVKGPRDIPMLLFNEPVLDQLFRNLAGIGGTLVMSTVPIQTRLPWILVLPVSAPAASLASPPTLIVRHPGERYGPHVLSAIVSKATSNGVLITFIAGSTAEAMMMSDRFGATQKPTPSQLITSSLAGLHSVCPSISEIIYGLETEPSTLMLDLIAVLFSLATGEDCSTYYKEDHLAALHRVAESDESPPDMDGFQGSIMSDGTVVLNGSRIGVLYYIQGSSSSDPNIPVIKSNDGSAMPSARRIAQHLLAARRLARTRSDFFWPHVSVRSVPDIMPRKLMKGKPLVVSFGQSEFTNPLAMVLHLLRPVVRFGSTVSHADGFLAKTGTPAADRLYSMYNAAGRLETIMPRLAGRVITTPGEQMRTALINEGPEDSMSYEKTLDGVISEAWEEARSRDKNPERQLSAEQPGCWDSVKTRLQCLHKFSSQSVSILVSSPSGADYLTNPPEISLSYTIGAKFKSTEKAFPMAPAGYRAFAQMLDTVRGSHWADVQDCFDPSSMNLDPSACTRLAVGMTVLNMPTSMQLPFHAVALDKEWSTFPDCKGKDFTAQSTTTPSAVQRGGKVHVLFPSDSREVMKDFWQVTLDLAGGSAPFTMIAGLAMMASGMHGRWTVHDQSLVIVMSYSDPEYMIRTRAVPEKAGSSGKSAMSDPLSAYFVAGAKSAMSDTDAKMIMGFILNPEQMRTAMSIRKKSAVAKALALINKNSNLSESEKSEEKTKLLNKVADIESKMKS